MTTMNDIREFLIDQIKEKYIVDNILTVYYREQKREYVINILHKEMEKIVHKHTYVSRDDGNYSLHMITHMNRTSMYEIKKPVDDDILDEDRRLSIDIDYFEKVSGKNHCYGEMIIEKENGIGFEDDF